MRKNILFLILLAVVCLPVFSNVYTVESVPDPKKSGQEYYVSNPDGVLSGQTVSSLNQRCANLDKTVEVELCVVAIENYDEDHYGDAHSFALDLFNTWGIGKSEKNTGVLLFLARGSRQIQIITGGGMEGLLPDITCGQIIDENIEYLKDNDFDTGMIKIAEGIASHCTSTEAQAELLLGWKRKESVATTFYYFIWGFVVLILIAILGYKKLKAAPGQRVSDIQRQAAGTQTASGCLSWIFPIPMLLFYLYYRYARKNVKQVPLKCPHCGKDMKIVQTGEDELYLTPTQLKERELKSMEHEVWRCPECKTTKLMSYKGQTARKYEECPECKAHAYETIDRLTLQKATYTHAGERKDTKRCAVCGFVGTAMVVLPMLVRAASTSSGGGGGFGGGGGRSSGGGSWGGGHSFGGGAGRRF